MDKYLFDIKMYEQKLMNYLVIYKRCRTPCERQRITDMINYCEDMIQKLRNEFIALTNRTISESVAP